MAIETVKMSSKGQIVIPRGIRNKIEAAEGTLFAVIGMKDTVVLKKISTPSREELIKDITEFSSEAKQKLQAMGVSESDLRTK